MIWEFGACNIVDETRGGLAVREPRRLLVWLLHVHDIEIALSGCFGEYSGRDFAFCFLNPVPTLMHDVCLSGPP